MKIPLYFNAPPNAKMHIPQSDMASLIANCLE